VPLKATLVISSALASAQSIDMRPGLALRACAFCLFLAGCLGWQGGTGKGAISPPGLALHDDPPRPRATLVGTLWPPADEPTFVVGRRLVVIAREGETAAEAETDRRGHFEARLPKPGRYVVIFSSEATEATAEVFITNVTSIFRVDLVARRR
jgi:hypothetical protein